MMRFELEYMKYRRKESSMLMNTKFTNAVAQGYDEVEEAPVADETLEEEEEINEEIDSYSDGEYDRNFDI
jgi:hypothetical protein